MPPIKPPVATFQTILAALSLRRKRYYRKGSSNVLPAKLVLRSAGQHEFLLIHCNRGKIFHRTFNQKLLGSLGPAWSTSVAPRPWQALLKPPHWAYLEELFSRPGSFTATPRPVRHHIEE